MRQPLTCLGFAGGVVLVASGVLFGFVILGVVWVGDKIADLVGRR